ncbi:C-type lectin domain family 10 member A-like [Diadema setosum]|uniref:C-type lectin domain family 10 member A-like n=1 Tax=Diadema setosum TaxID=31175 RepID=UPI003B3BB1B4
MTAELADFGAHGVCRNKYNATYTFPIHMHQQCKIKTVNDTAVQLIPKFIKRASSPKSCAQGGYWICRLPVNDCPDGWVNNTDSGSCYMLVKSEETYSAAKNICERHNAQVVSLNTKEELEFVWQYVSNELTSYKEFWIGLNHVNTSDWQWEDGTSLRIAPSAFWAVGEPNNWLSQQEDNAHVTSNSKVNDASGSLSYYFVCEMKLLDPKVKL